MCVVSMVMDHYGEKWDHYGTSTGYVFTYPAFPSAAEIEEFKQLLERARKYDAEHNEPNCELAAKKARIQRLADKLGVKVDFL